MAEYLLFTGAFLASAIAPGADTFLILSRAIVNKKLAIAAAAGITTGKILMVSIAYFGLAALLQSNGELLWLLKIFGAAFLIFRAVHLLNPKKIAAPTRKGGEFIGALAIGFSNPQPLAFYLSIMPSVLTATELPILILIVALGFALVSTFYIFLASVLSKWLASEANYLLVNRLIAVGFLALAVIVVVR